jgi:hypothetical protein
MISDAPVAAASNMAGIYEKIGAFIATAKSSAADGLTWAEFGELLIALMRLAIATLDTVAGLSGAEKKGMVIEAVGLLFDAVADKAVPLAVYPLWLLVRPSVRSLLIAVASGAVERLLPLVRSAT